MNKNSIRAAAAAATVAAALVSGLATASAASAAPQRISAGELHSSLQQAIALERAQGPVSAATGGPINPVGLVTAPAVVTEDAAPGLMC